MHQQFSLREKKQPYVFAVVHQTVVVVRYVVVMCILDHFKVVVFFCDVSPHDFDVTVAIGA